MNLYNLLLGEITQRDLNEDDMAMLDVFDDMPD